MPHITGVDPARRRSGWIEVQLDGASAFRLPEEDWRETGLAIGDPVDASVLARIQAAAERAEAIRGALRYLSVRPRSRRELERALGRKRMPPEAIDQAVDRMVELGYMDDRAFAAAFARDRIRLRPMGVRRMRDELLGKGVSRTDAGAGIEEALRDEDVTEADLLERAARKRAERLRTSDPERAARRLMSYLVRRGFPPDRARAWIDEWASRAGRTNGQR